LLLLTLALISTQCGRKDREAQSGVVLESSTDETSQAVKPARPILPVSCPTAAEMEADKTFGRYTAQGCRRLGFRRLEGYRFETRWLKDTLDLMKEPLIVRDLPADVAVFRLTVLPSFSHPRAVRIQRIGDHTILIDKNVRSVDLDGGTSELTIAAYPVSEKVWRSLRREVNEAGFWEMESCVDRRGFDGAMYVLEALADDRYHVVERWEPETGSFPGLCWYLERLASNRAKPLRRVTEATFDFEPIYRSELERTGARFSTWY